MGPPATRNDPWGAVRSMLAAWRWVTRTAEIWWIRRAGLPAVESARRTRLASLVAFARANSAFYREVYRDVPGQPPLEALPVVTKRALMARFDEWVTDPEVTRAGVEAFIGDRGRIGEFFLGRYIVWKSSGTTGEPGIFVEDAQALDVYDALIAAQLEAAGVVQRFAGGVATQGGRAALIAATGEHFATVASWCRLRDENPWLGSRCLSVLDPLPRLVAELNAYQPAFVASYPTMLWLLALEKDAGRLAINPVCLWSGGECLAPAARRAIERAFGAPVLNEFGASECMSIAFGCNAGWLHVNSDWVILEPVDRDGAPTPAGEASHSVLLTNLANHVQPVIRYNLGDSILVKQGPCACGNALPAIRVEGRRDDIVALAAPDGRIVRLLPLALATVVEEAAGVHRFQIVQDAPERLLLRLEPGEPAGRQAAWRAASAALRDYLRSQSLANVRVALDRKPPIAEPRSGKLRQVVVACRV
jgi:phenylacetate-CoA ligase